MYEIIYYPKTFFKKAPPLFAFLEVETDYVMTENNDIDAKSIYTNNNI